MPSPASGTDHFDATFAPCHSVRAAVALTFARCRVGNASARARRANAELCRGAALALRDDHEEAARVHLAVISGDGTRTTFDPRWRDARGQCGVRHADLCERRRFLPRDSTRRAQPRHRWLARAPGRTLAPRGHGHVLARVIE